MSKKERKIGEVFQLGNVKLRVEKSYKWNSCEGCYITRLEGKCSDYYRLTGNFLMGDRNDKQDVIFKEVED
jgi:hypothetical protein